MVYNKGRKSLRPREILAEEKKCIETHAPGCQASCPLHLDARAMMGFIKEGNFDDALSIIEKSTYFPRILAQSCPGHCYDSCKRAEVGDAIRINGLERFVAGNVLIDEREIKPYDNLRLKIAVVGAAISGLMAASYLFEKGFKVSVFEKEKTWVKSLKDMNGMTEQLIQSDLGFLKKYLHLYFKTEIGKDISYKYLLGAFDGIYIEGLANIEESGLTLSSSGKPLFDEETLQSSNPKVFVGGSVISDSLSLVEKMASGKKAAVSLDRYLKKVSLTASRPYEGIYKTDLLVNIDDVKPLPAVEAKDNKGYTVDEAQEEASRCLDCHCTECVRACKMLEKFGEKPRQYVRQIANNLIVTIGKHTANHMINACNLCGLCGEVCPNSLNMGDICLSAREEMVRKNKMPLAIHDFPIRDMLFSNSGEFSLARHAPGTKDSKYLFFPGCQLSAGAPQYIRPLYDYLRQRLPGSTGLFLGCCGAPAHWSGRNDLFLETISELKKTWEEMGKPIVVTGCTTCFQEFKNIDDMETTTIWQCIDKYGLPEQAIKDCQKDPLAIHDPCTTRYEPQIYESVRNILEKLGCPIEELVYSKDKTSCCGYGGLALFGNTGVTVTSIKDRVEQSPRDYLTYCWVCRDYLGKMGQKTTYHLLDLIFGNCKLAPYYDISDKRFNRRHLKESLLKDLWHEESGMEELTSVPKVLNKHLYINEDLKEVLSDRLILFEDVANTIEYGETSGNKVMRPSDKHYFTHFRPGIITYWVEYSLTDSGYILHNAYSHRLEILEEKGEEKI